jgi:hypothetical protein
MPLYILISGRCSSFNISENYGYLCVTLSKISKGTKGPVTSSEDFVLKNLFKKNPNRPVRMGAFLIIIRNIENNGVVTKRATLFISSAICLQLIVKARLINCLRAVIQFSVEK